MSVAASASRPPARCWRTGGAPEQPEASEPLEASDPITEDAQAEIDTARQNRWIAPADARYFEQQAYRTLVDAGMETAWSEPADLDRLARAEEVLLLDPALVKRTKLEAYRRAHIEATADHDLTEAEEAGLERARSAFGLSDSDLAEELSLMERLSGLDSGTHCAHRTKDGAPPLCQTST